jgi:hypothetical protein
MFGAAVSPLTLKATGRLHGDDDEEAEQFGVESFPRGPREAKRPLMVPVVVNVITPV